MLCSINFKHKNLKQTIIRLGRFRVKLLDRAWETFPAFENQKLLVYCKNYEPL